MTLRARLTLGLVAIALLIAAPLVVAMVALQRAEGTATELRDREIAASLLLARVRRGTQELRRADNAVLFVSQDSARAALSAAYMQQQTRELAALADSLTGYGLDSLVTTIRASARRLETFGALEAAAVADRETDLAERTSEQHVVPAIDSVDASLAAAEAALRARSHLAVDEALSAARESRRIGALLLALAVVAAAGVAVWLTRSIERPVSELERGMDAVAGGNFSHELTILPGRRDEFGRLAASFRSMTDQLAELDRIKAEFVSVASHELKTPINVILGYLKLLEENLYGPINERQAQVIGTLQGQAASLGRLTQHLLDVSRFEAGAGGLALRPVGLRAFLAQVEQTHGVLALQRDIAFTVTPAGDLPEVVHWDADRMHEVIGNLLSNAFKFTEPGGRVDVKVSPLHEAVYVEVRDTGAGIAPDQIPHIFDKFYQANNQGAAAAKGSGLGLAITKEIVEAHGGSIAVESRRGEGTKFSIMLPVNQPEEHSGDDGTPAVDAVPAEEPAPAATAR